MPKGKKGAGDADLQTDEVLQGVILADSYQTRFRPISLEKPKVLMPLVNIPMLEYTLEFLAAGGANEILVLCSAHCEQIEAYVKASSWIRKAPQLLVRIIVSEDSYSVGAALRHLDTLDLIKGDFVLVSGDIISTIKLPDVLKAHRERVNRDKRHIMTCVFKKAAPDHRTRAVEDDLVVVLSEEGQIVHYEDRPKSSSIEIETTVLEEHSSVEIRYDLMDTHIDICTPEVLSLMFSNFDWTCMRKGLLKGVLGSDILGQKINAHIVTGEYAARVTDLRTYDSISKDIIHGWTHPMVPSNNLLCGTSYQFFRRNVYKEGKLSLARSCRVEEDTVLGEGTSVGDGTFISGSVIGQHCRIGKNCIIRGSYLWSSVTVGDGVTLDRAVLCDGASVHDGATISKGCVLSFNTAVGKNITLPEYSKVTLREEVEDEIEEESDEDEEESDEDEEDNIMLTKAPVSKAKAGPSTSSSSENKQGNAPAASLGPEGRGHLFLSNPRLQFTNSVADCDPSFQPSNRHTWQDSDEDDDWSQGSGASGQEDARQDFKREVYETLSGGIANGASREDVELELSSLKMSADKSVVEFAEAVFLALFEIGGAPTQGDLGPLSGEQLKNCIKAVKKLLTTWKSLLTKYGQEDESQQKQIFLGLVQVCVAKDSLYAGFFSAMLQYVVQMDIVAAGPILQWARETRAGDDVAQQELAKSAGKLLAVLEEQEESDEEDDEDEDDEDDEDESDQEQEKGRRRQK